MSSSLIFAGSKVRGLITGINWRPFRRRFWHKTNSWFVAIQRFNRIQNSWPFSLRLEHDCSSRFLTRSSPFSNKTSFIHIAVPARCLIAGTCDDSLALAFSSSSCAVRTPWTPPAGYPFYPHFLLYSLPHGSTLPKYRPKNAYFIPESACRL